MRKILRSPFVALLLIPFLFQCGEPLEPQEPTKPEVIPVTTVRLDKTSLSLKEGEEVQLAATIEPSNASDKSVSWKSSDANVATVSSTGLVKAVAEGNTTITVSSGNGKTATCQVAVEKKAPATVPVSSIKLDKTSLGLKEGEEAQLTATVEPDNASDKSVSWKSSDTNVATVSSTGLVKAVAEGNTTITVSSGNGKTATCQVTVDRLVIPVSSVTLDQSSLVLEEGDDAQLVATVLPENATDKTIRWESSDGTVASVDGTGKVKALHEGTSQIIAKAGDASAACTVTVNAKPVIPAFAAVDMGLSVQWANMNLGAEDAAEAGHYFAWGETAPKTDYSWATYSLSGGTPESITRYGDFDDTYTLVPTDDAATIEKGNGWRLPTKHEFQELIDNCDLTWSDSPEGYHLVSKINGNSLFLPATGHMEGTTKVKSASLARYWTSSAGSYDEEAAYMGMYNSRGMTIALGSGQRAFGYAIRPVQGTAAAVPESKVTVDGKEFDFGEVKVGETGRINVTVSNVGNAELRYHVSLPPIVYESDHLSENITVSGNSQGANVSHTLGPGESDTFILLYTPKEPGEEAHSKFVVYTNAVNGNKRINVKGRSAASGSGGSGDNSNEDIEYGDWYF